MASRKLRRRNVGGSILGSIARWKKADPVYARLHEAEFDKMQLARRVRALREAKHVSQGELARRAGTKQPAIARLESGRVLPRLDLLQKIAVALQARLEVGFRTRHAG
jgi:HTH-type transcriptional regulator/antitoxin HipB